ncbi:MAG: metallophosphatase family protein [Bacteroidales bacterium]|jgi:hypothetical protein|nr:metallophosphatase family protein [Bacteroidales bacterium]
MKIGLLSDTHGWIHPRIYEHFKDVDEIWHAGDIGGLDTADALSAFKPLKAVYGNIDDARVRQAFSGNLLFSAGDVRVWITHIGGYPGHYDRRVVSRLHDDPPALFICGHSHIARVQYDQKWKFLYINPGAAGYQGFHNMMTIMTLRADGGKISDLRVIELGERGRAISPDHQG